MAVQRKVAILVPYFGEFPWYFRYFLHSCSFNFNFQFLIITDNIFTQTASENICFIQMSIKEVETRIYESLSLEVSIQNPYKLCDLKPAYGVIFQDLIQGFKFWGQSDIDVILGDLNEFFTDEFLDSYDYISVRHDYTTGCFSIFRNIEKVNYLFTKSKDYPSVFLNHKNFCFDQCSFAMDILATGKDIFEIETEIESYTHLVRKAQLKGEIRAHFDFLLIEGVPGRMEFQSGKLIYDGEIEAILYHLHHFKKIYSPKTVKNINRTFKISSSSIYH